MNTEELTTIKNIENWVGAVVEGFTEYVFEEDLPEDVCLHCICDQWCEENATALLYDANQLGKADPDLAIDYLIEKRRIHSAIADTLLGNLIIALTEMHRPEVFEGEAVEE